MLYKYRDTFTQRFRLQLINLKYLITSGIVRSIQILNTTGFTLNHSQTLKTYRYLIRPQSRPSIGRPKTGMFYTSLGG